MKVFSSKIASKSQLYDWLANQTIFFTRKMLKSSIFFNLINDWKRHLKACSLQYPTNINFLSMFAKFDSTKPVEDSWLLLIYIIYGFDVTKYFLPKNIYIDNAQNYVSQYRYKGMFYTKITPFIWSILIPFLDFKPLFFDISFFQFGQPTI